jgi:large subunit ribosomal protein L25
MTTNFEVVAETRSAKGTGASRRLRRAGKIPGIIYGGSKPATMVTFDHDPVWHLLENEASHSSILQVKTDGKPEKAILRDVHYHPYRQLILHVDLQRVSESERIHMSIPLHFTGEDIAPGVKMQGGIVSHLMTEIDITCLASNLPEYLTADVSGLNLGDSIHLSDLQLPDGVEITSLAHGGDDLAVVTIVAVRGSAEAETEEGEETAEGKEDESEGKEGE